MPSVDDDRGDTEVGHHGAVDGADEHAAEDGQHPGADVDHGQRPSRILQTQADVA